MKSKLSQIVEYSYQNVPFYSRNPMYKSAEQLSQFALITKKDIMRNEMDFLSLEHKKYYLEGRVRIKYTSGTTGESTVVFWDEVDDALADLSAWRYRKIWYGIDPQSRYVSFFSNIYFGNQIDTKCQNIYLSSKHLLCSKKIICEGKIDEFVEAVLKFQPEWILVQPSIFVLCSSLIDQGIFVNILRKVKYIEFTGEYISTQFIDYLKHTYPHIKFANMYGATEMGVIAITCPFGHMHVLENNVYLEILDDTECLSDDNAGSVILTTLRNTAMPLIRYQIGDRARFVKTKCPCGIDSKIIQLLAGRQFDYFLCDGVKRPIYLLSAAVERVNYEYNYPIYKVNFIQREGNLIEVNLFLKQNFRHWKRSISTTMEEELHKEISPNINFTFVFSKISETSSKEPFFKSLILDREKI